MGGRAVGRGVARGWVISVRRERTAVIRAAFLGGPLDGGVRELAVKHGEAPGYWVTPSQTSVTETGAVVIHRYRRGTDCGGYRGMACWTYLYEGSVAT